MRRLAVSAPYALQLGIVLFVVSVGIGLILFGLRRSYTLVVNGQPYHLVTTAFSSSDLIRQTGYDVAELDEVSPPAKQFFLLLPETIILNQARPVSVVTPETTQTLVTTEQIPANLLAQSGIRLYPEDLVLVNGVAIDPYLPLNAGQAVVLQFMPARRITLTVNDRETVFFTQARTAQQALEEQGIVLKARDALSIPADQWLKDGDQISLRQARMVTIMSGESAYTVETAAVTVNAALRDGGLLPQNIDRTIPAEDAPVPADGKIELIRGSEEITLLKEETAYANTYQEDPNAELDTVSVVVPGQVGYVVTRTRVKFENGKEVSSLREGPWKASDPVNGVLGRGSKVVIRTEVVDGETIEYWRKVSVYATSYHPAEFTTGNQTRSGLPLSKGIIAVSSAWYDVMAFQPVFIPGYGPAVVGDSGGGMPDRYWIDLGYDDSNYVGWHSWTTLYFLTPVPAYIPLVLP